MLVSVIIAGCKAEPVASSVRFAFVSGEVSFQRPDDQATWIPALEGMQMGLQDTLMTSKSSEADVDVDENQHVWVGEQVRMAVDTLLNTVKNSKVARLRVDTGALYVRIQRKLATDEAFEVITPTCIMGVRGTEFVVVTRGADTQLFVLEGSVKAALNPKDLSNLAGRAYGEELPEDSWIVVEAGQMLEVPWGVSGIESLKANPIDFNKMPLDILNALTKAESSKLDPYREAIDDAQMLQNQALEAKDETQQTYSDVPVASEKPYVDPASGRVYARIDLDMSAREAHAYCLERGGHLMTITSQAEQDLANAMIAKGEKFWYLIGLVQKPGSVEPKGGFEWVTGEPVTYTNWHKRNGIETEPSDLSGRGEHENDVVMLNFAGDPVWKLGDWNDMNLVEKVGDYGFLCEWEDVSALYGGLSGSEALINANAASDLPQVIQEALNYEQFQKIQLNDAIQDIQKVMGTGEKIEVVQGDTPKTWWHFKQDKRFVSVVTQVDATGVERVTLCNHENLLTPEDAWRIGGTEKDLNAVAVRGLVNQFTSLQDARAYLGTNGILSSRIIEKGERYDFYQWRDNQGYGYQMAVNVDKNTVSNSFLNPLK